MTLPEIIEALEKATEPSRLLDWDIQCAAFPNQSFVPYDWRPDEWMTKIGGRMVPVTRFDKGGSTGDRYCPRYTYSIDRACMLANILLPGWRLCFEAVDGIAYDLYLIGPNYRDDQLQLNSSAPVAGYPIATAILMATLKALQSRGDA